MALGKGLGKRAADSYIHGDEAGRSKVRIEAGEQFEVEAAIGGEIEGASAGELHGAMSSKVSSLSQNMELLDVDRLIGEGEANGILIVDFDIFDVEGEGGEGAVEDPPLGLPERTAQAERTGDGGMSRELAGEIGVPEGVEVELVGLKCESGGIAIAQLDVAVDE